MITKLKGEDSKRLVTLSDVVTFLVCLQYLVSFFQCATKVGHNQVLTRGHELGVREEEEEEKFFSLCSV